MLKCKICGYECKSILSNHLKNKHNISSKEYKEMYPGSETTSAEYRKMMSDRNKSDKMREITINRNKSDYMRNAVSNRNKDKDFINKCKEGIRKSEKFHKSVSKSVSERNKIMWKNEDYREKMRESISRSQKLVMNTPERKSFQSKVMKKNWKNGLIAKKMLDAPKNRLYGHRSNYYSEFFDKEFICKSDGERDFIKLMEDMKADDLQYEPIHIHGNGITYIPDFLVRFKDKKYLVEVKFDDDYKDHIDKVMLAIEYCENNDIKYCWVTRFYGIENIRNNNDIEVSVLC